jgi:hypothetical protein
MLMDYNLLESETPGETWNGLVSLRMKMKLGMIIRVSKKNLTMFSRMMEHGG